MRTEDDIYTVVATNLRRGVSRRIDDLRHLVRRRHEMRDPLGWLPWPGWLFGSSNVVGCLERNRLWEGAWEGAWFLFCTSQATRDGWEVWCANAQLAAIHLYLFGECKQSGLDVVKDVSVDDSPWWGRATDRRGKKIKIELARPDAFGCFDRYVNNLIFEPKQYHG